MSPGPAPRPLDDGALSELLGRHRFGTLASLRRSGHPHLTTMLYRWDPATRTASMATTTDRAKVTQLRRDPRAALHVPGEDISSFAVVEGDAELSAPTTVAGDAVGRQLRALLSPPGATPAEEQAFDENMVAEQRLVITLRASRLYGLVLRNG
ncbi:pyridoxamine 5'-phosphate oxidase (plasmid) [Pseudonocardia sp. EC080610-09]|uniref:pyridoxamine 5'-phosphate oxidase family protein n=1 Tax=unclassified Pseudonocardia TaxID=2619320 RepID=UPI000706116F|nr:MULTISPECIES: TIGR03618 family F420-dependent PPOX class oxidoreductase [unclassified Pseudonocardia]ALL79831.1 pyridoxamine 5'-phosphate oxidase [Pseudonocardia sp. EC080610-09]ALL85790.1 pyridoxamine 5'-phosphate oxidase [Pseudonocardia sp. EC080619-01]